MAAGVNLEPSEDREEALRLLFHGLGVRVYGLRLEVDFGVQDL